MSNIAVVGTGYEGIVFDFRNFYRYYGVGI